MQQRWQRRGIAAISTALMLPALLLAQGPKPAGPNDGQFGVGVKVSTLGIGVEGAVRATDRLNVRAGINAFDYSHNLSNDGIHYDGHLNLRSAQATLDYFFAGDFHVSPGVLAYNGNKATATASVAAGQQFTLGGTSYSSGLTNPVTGTAAMDLNKAAPLLLLGWGNLIPRHGSSLSVNVEAGVAYEGSPRVGLSLAGTICDPSGLNCQNAATAAPVQSNLQAEQLKLNTKLQPFKFYPVVSLGLSYAFK